MGWRFLIFYLALIAGAPISVAQGITEQKAHALADQSIADAQRFLSFIPNFVLTQTQTPAVLIQQFDDIFFRYDMSRKTLRLSYGKQTRVGSFYYSTMHEFMHAVFWRSVQSLSLYPTFQAIAQKDDERVLELQALEIQHHALLEKMGYPGSEPAKPEQMKVLQEQLTLINQALVPVWNRPNSAVIVFAVDELNADLLPLFYSQNPEVIVEALRPYLPDPASEALEYHRSFKVQIPELMKDDRPLSEMGKELSGSHDVYLTLYRTRKPIYDWMLRECGGRSESDRAKCFYTAYLKIITLTENYLASRPEPEISISDFVESLIAQFQI